MITYFIKSGIFASNGADFGKGYSGHLEGLNNSDMVAAKMMGPLPPGLYKMSPPRVSVTLGPFVIDLKMLDGESYGRDLFRIHGDNSKGDKSASNGCIVAGPSVRKLIWTKAELTDPYLLVRI